MEENNSIVVVHPATQVLMKNLKNDRKSNESIWKKPTEEQHTIIMGEFNKEHFIYRFFRKRSKFYKTIERKEYLCCVGTISYMYARHYKYFSSYYLEVSSETIKYTLKVSFSEFCKHDIGYVGHLIMICHDKKENEIRFV